MTNISHSAPTAPAFPTILTTFATKDLPHTPTVIKAALRVLTGIPNRGVFMTSEAHVLEYLLPEAINPETPLHVIALNDTPALDLKALALRPPECMNMNTVNRLHNDTFVWFGREDEPCAAVSARVDWCGGSVLRLFITPTLAYLVYDETGEELFDELSSSASCAGINYNPYNVWTDAELAEAARTAERRGISGDTYDFDEHQIHLVLCAFEKSRLVVSTSVVPSNFPAERYLSRVAPDVGKAIVRHCLDKDTYVLEDGVSLVSARLELCEQVARAIAVRCVQDLLTIHRTQSNEEILDHYSEAALKLKSVTRAEACWSICRAGEMLGWAPPALIVEELEQYHIRS